MRIAILTLPLDRNYGGILQCYALQFILESMGHEVKVLSKPRYGRFYFLIWFLSVCKRLLKRCFLGKKISIFKAPHEIVRKNIDLFINQYIHKYVKRQWSTHIAEKFDAIIVGSDQIWRPEYFSPIEEAFLSFAGEVPIKRISYAASFGVDKCEYDELQLKICSQLLQRFNAVSVREYSGIEICRKYFRVNAVQVLDPTLLLTTDNYKELIERRNTRPSSGNLLVYILDETPEKKKIVEMLATEKGLVPFYINVNTEDENIPLEKRVKISIEQWLRSFSDASLVVTDSFHGCVFSVIFKRQFIAIGNEERGLSRFYSLLNLCSLNNRLIFSSKDYGTYRSLLSEPINYDKVYEKLRIERKRSVDFIKEALKNKI